MNKRILLCFAGFLILAAQAYTSGKSEYTIDKAIEEQSKYIINQCPDNTNIAIINITSSMPELSKYIIDEFPNYLVNNKKGLTIVDRHSLDSIQKEINFQLSGEVSDSEMVSIGKKLGAELIISGSIYQLGKILRFNVKILDVTTAKIAGSNSCDVKENSKLKSLYPSYSAPSSAKKNSESSKIPYQKPEKEYSNDFHTGFYLGYNYSLEAPFGFSLGWINNKISFYIDTEFNFPYYQGYSPYGGPDYTGSGDMASSYMTYIFQNKSTSFTWEEIIGIHYPIYLPYLWVAGGIGFKYENKYLLFSEYWTSNGSYYGTMWHGPASPDVNFLLQAGLLFKYRHFYAAAKYKYIFNNGSSFDASIGYVWDYGNWKLY